MTVGRTLLRERKQRRKRSREQFSHGRLMIPFITLSERPSVVVGGHRALDPNPSGDWVTLHIATYRSKPDHLRRAVRSALGQTHKHTRVVVISDGDPAPPWEPIADLKDKRLVKYWLPANRGQFFVHELALRSTPDPFFGIQDSDDWSPRDRVARQVKLLRAHRADGCFAGIRNYNLDGSRSVVTPSPYTFRERRHLPPIGLHVGLFASEALRAVGGYYAGLRLGYDSLVILMLAFHGRTVYTNDVLYHRERRADSQTQNRSTGMQSARRDAARKKLASLYEQMKRSRSAAATAKMIQQCIPQPHQRELERHAKKLREIIQKSGAA